MQVYQQPYGRFAQMEVPTPTRRGTCNPASLQVGVIGLTIRLTPGCSKLQLIPNDLKHGHCVCNECGRFFNVPYEARP